MYLEKFPAVKNSTKFISRPNIFFNSVTCRGHELPTSGKTEKFSPDSTGRVVQRCIDIGVFNYCNWPRPR